LTSIWYAMAAAYISNLRTRLRASMRTIEQLAIRDGLTNTWNRRHIDALLASELQRKARIGGELCACMIDLDHFKDINDRFGHAAGDAVLKSVAARLQGELRSIDQLGRFGGEEFLILLPGVSLGEARACVERLRAAIADQGVLSECATHVTISAGVAECAASESADAFLARIDRALYRAKHLGRNRVESDRWDAAQAA
jgi:diguanylate cyclase (GGDEF)-like protein